MGQVVFDSMIRRQAVVAGRLSRRSGVIQRQGNRYQASSAGVVLQTQLLSAAVHLFQPCPGITQAETLASLVALNVHAGSVIRNLNCEGTIVPGGTYLEIAGSRGMCNAMPDRISAKGCKIRLGTGIESRSFSTATLMVRRSPKRVFWIAR